MTISLSKVNEKATIYRFLKLLLKDLKVPETVGWGPIQANVIVFLSQELIKLPDQTVDKLIKDIQEFIIEINVLEDKSRANDGVGRSHRKDQSEGRG